MLLDALSCLLAVHFEVQVAPADNQAMLAAAAAFDPTLAVIDVGADGAELKAARLLARFHSGIPILCLLPDAVAPLPELRWVKKSACTAEAFLNAIHAAGAVQIGHQGLPLVTPPEPVLGVISPRERQVLGLLMRGLTMKEVARILNIAPRTVAFHKYKVMEKNELRTNSELISFAIRHGIRRG